MYFLCRPHTPFLQPPFCYDISLGNYVSGLGVPKAVHDQIRKNTAYKTEEDKKEALLQYFLKYVPMASWQRVAGALYWREEKTALEAVKAIMILKPTGQSMTVHVWYA